MTSVLYCSVLYFISELMAAQTEHRRKMSKFYAAQDQDVDIEDTEIGRVRIKLSRLMAKKMSGNPAFKRSVEQMQSLISSGGVSILQEKVSTKIHKRPTSARLTNRPRQLTTIADANEATQYDTTENVDSRKNSVGSDSFEGRLKLPTVSEDDRNINGREKGWKPLSTT